MITVTYDQLYAYDLDIKAFKKNYPGIALLLQSRINAFHEKNKVQFDALNEGMIKIQKKFIVHDEKGNMKLEMVDGVQELQYVPVYTDLETASIISNRAEIKRRFEQHVKRFTSLTVKIDI